MKREELEKILKSTVPNCFGLGFIQCKINQYERIHIYHPKLIPTVDIVEEVHNHRYNFESTVLLGEITNKKYKFNVSSGSNPNFTHYLRDESCNELVRSETKDDMFGIVELVSTDTISKGETYFMNFNEFHTFQTNRCITYLKRSDYCQDMAQVIRLIGSTAICPFSVKLSQSECWETINEVLKDYV